MDLTKFKKLSDREHVLKRPGRYVGSVVDTPVIMPDGTVVSVPPAFGLIFTEAITNSIDHSKTSEGKELDTIRVSMSILSQTIIVSDNGAGIPIAKHPIEKMYIPEMVLANLKSGTNFDDEEDNQLAGQNGEGVSLTNIFSKQFNVKINDGKKKYEQHWVNNMQTGSTPFIENYKTKETGTTISYEPDMERFGCEQFMSNHVAYIKEIVIEMAVVNPNIKFYFNNNLIKMKFDEYAKRFCEEVITYSDKDVDICIGLNPDKFRDISFINSTRVMNGGTHIDYFGNKLIQAFRLPLAKKMKTTIKPNTIKQNLFLFFNIRMNNPRYDSQTKDRLISMPGEYGFSFEVNKAFSADIVKSNIYKKMIDVVTKSIAIAEWDNAIKKVKAPKNIKEIEKYESAIEKKDRHKCSLFLVEGDSAANPLISARDPQLHGIFPLRGKLTNVRGMQPAKILQNKEIKSIIQILGVDLKTKDVENLRYGKVVIATDADLDGFHICGLSLNMFINILPKFIMGGMVYKLKTPIITGMYNKQPIEFFSQRELERFDGAVTKIQFHKGLGGWDTEDFERFLHDPKYLEQIEWDDEAEEALDLVFNKERADDRKLWLGGNVYEG